VFGELALEAPALGHVLDLVEEVQTIRPASRSGLVRSRSA